MSNPFDFRAAAKQVLDIEVAALQELDKYFDEQFEQACELILSNSGKVVVMGMGKSATLATRLQQRLPAQVHQRFSFTRVKQRMVTWV